MVVYRDQTAGNGLVALEESGQVDGWHRYQLVSKDLQNSQPGINKPRLWNDGVLSFTVARQRGDIAIPHQSRGDRLEYVQRGPDLRACRRRRLDHYPRRPLRRFRQSHHRYVLSEPQRCRYERFHCAVGRFSG